MKPSTTKLASEINRLHRSVIIGAVKTLEQAIEEAKARVKRGDWELWMESNLEFSKTTAQNYMRCFDKRDELKNARLASIWDAYQLLTDKNSDAQFVASVAKVNPELFEEVRSGAKSLAKARRETRRQGTGPQDKKSATLASEWTFKTC